MKQWKLLPIAAGFALAAVVQIASAAPTVITLPGVALPAGAPALPDLTLVGGGALVAPALPMLPALPVPALPVPSLPASGGSLFITGGVGGATYLIKPTTITADGLSLPGLPGLPGLPALP